MKIIKTKFKNLLVFKSKNFYDNRGYFRELAIEKLIKQKLIFTVVSKSKKNVLRGLHMQKKFQQGKYISVVKGKILDVVVDCRKKSKTFGKHFAIKIKHDSNFSIYIPEGFAHGFVCLSKSCTIYYRCTNYRHKQSETTLRWNDPKLKINWRVKKPILSKKDRNGKLLYEIQKHLLF